jgi:hypothetical protein
MRQPVQLKLASVEALDLADDFDAKAAQLLSFKSGKGSLIGLPQVSIEPISPAYPQGIFRAVVNVNVHRGSSYVVDKSYCRDEAGVIICHTSVYVQEGEEWSYIKDEAAGGQAPATATELDELFAQLSVQSPKPVDVNS